MADNPAPTSVSAGAVWAAEFRNVELVWLAAVPEDVADDARASTSEALGSPVVAEREAAEEADARVREWVLDECGMDGL